MSDKLIKYTVSIYTENSVGLLNRISAIFQRRHINIESFNSSMTEALNTIGVEKNDSAPLFANETPSSMETTNII